MPADFEEYDDGVERSGGAEKDRYRFLLAEALGGGVIQPSKKDTLKRYVVHVVLGRYRMLHVTWVGSFRIALLRI